MSFILIRPILWILLGKDLVVSAILPDFPIAPFSPPDALEATTGPSDVETDTTAPPIPYGPMPFDRLGRAQLLQVYNTGRTSVDPPATDMNKVVWSTELAEAAGSALETCVYEIVHAQLISDGLWLIQMASYSDIDVHLSDTLTQWFTFGDYYNYHQKSCSAHSQAICNIYRLLSWSSMSAVGCSQHYCKNLHNSFTGETKHNQLYWKCNHRNIGYFTDATLNPYTNGTVNESCTQCESGSGWCDNGLCSNECDVTTANCSCTLDPLCSGNGQLNVTTCECNCTENWVGNSCDQCAVMCQTYSKLNQILCQCECLRGYQLNSTTTNCEDVDECQASHGCEHTCENTQGSYICKCLTGFSLNDDGQTCALASGYSSFLSGATSLPTTTIDLTTSQPNPVCGVEIVCNGSGVLDPQTCECYCASGYKGSACDEQCPITDRECWSGYRQPPAGLGTDYCPVYCFGCACQQSENACENNGTYSKVPGYELHNGMCRCYCPFPWSGLTCEECNLSCYNGGTLDPSTCTCTCPVGYRPPDCSAQCKADISRWCTSRLAPFCDQMPVIRKHCPVMCGTCAL
ncbi:multiple epidermal growth factor-like domains protein 6 [Acanthaster planci]|uniref:Multiple epidermal growth factor-like domains protein 6 n=1 Tax=Acanthaster planci TaxID=133434 RepID=A0A8B7ZVI2_ACAPL|nr:multiple epidermal growth factor-like domains protein 6 [Acanthaster planci]